MTSDTVFIMHVININLHILSLICIHYQLRLPRDVSGRFKCSIDHAKRLFYKAANNVFGKIGRIASEEVTLQLVKSKCIPILLYGLEVCELNKSQIGVTGLYY